MKPLTKEQRRKIYLDIAEYILERYLTENCYVCNELDKRVKYLRNLKEEFPEFFLFKPIDDKYEGLAWFSESYPISPFFTDKDNVEGNIARIDALLLWAAMCE